LVQGCGGAEFQTGGILEYLEDLKRGTKEDIGPKDIFEIASSASLLLGSILDGDYFIIPFFNFKRDQFGEVRVV
jgi:hypothetical protein